MNCKGDEIMKDTKNKSNRKYGQCLWCRRTIDITNSDRELCEVCCKYPNQMEMEKDMARIEGL